MVRPAFLDHGLLSLLKACGGADILEVI